MAFKLIALFALLAAAQAVDVKGPGIDVEIEGRKYFVSDNPNGAFEAIQVCEGKGMNLINLETKNESLAVFAWLQSQPDHVNKRFWTGASRSSGSDVWTWSVAGDFDLAESHWAPGYPSIELEFQAEIVIQGSLGGWSDADTFAKRLHEFCELNEEAP